MGILGELENLCNFSIATSMEQRMDELDEHLHQLALDAQKYFGKIKGRQRLMQLWGEVYGSSRFPQRSRINRKIFLENPDEIYDDAVYHLMEYLLRNISKYDPKRGSVMAWVSYLLEKRFVPEAIERVQRDRNRIQPSQNANSTDGRDNPPTAVEVLAAAPPDPSQIKLLLIQKCFEEDEDNLFRTTCMQAYPFINFRDVALKHHVNGLNFTEIAKLFAVPYTSLKSFYDRQLKKFAPTIRHYVENTILI